jgi:hypothetical protein
MPPQPFKEGAWHLQDRSPVTEEMHTTLTAMLWQMNRAIDTLPDLSSRLNLMKQGRRMLETPN